MLPSFYREPDSLTLRRGFGRCLRCRLWPALQYSNLSGVRVGAVRRGSRRSLRRELWFSLRRCYLSVIRIGVVCRLRCQTRSRSGSVGLCDGLFRSAMVWRGTSSRSRKRFLRSGMDARLREVFRSRMCNRLRRMFPRCRLRDTLCDRILGEAIRCRPCGWPFCRRTCRRSTRGACHPVRGRFRGRLSYRTARSSSVQRSLWW